MRRKVILSYKKNSGFNQALLSLSRELVDFLGADEENNTIAIDYENNCFYLLKENVEFEETITDKEGNLIKLKKNINIIKSMINRNANYWNYKINIPSKVIEVLKLKENPTVNISQLVDKIMVEPIGGKMAKVIVDKANKGGIGKTFTTVQLGHGLALKGYKVLLLTSDSQNNILHYTLSKERLSKLPEKYDMAKGLRHSVLFGDKEDYYIKLRKNLYCLPAESSVFTKKFEKEFSMYLEKKKEEYDYIIIDSIPTMDIDKTFVDCADKVIIPVFPDYSTIEGILNVIEEVGVDKVDAVIPNLYKGTKVQKSYYNNLKKALENLNILFPEPIRELSQIESLLDKGKTIWETRTKAMLEVQKTFLDVIIQLEK